MSARMVLVTGAAGLVGRPLSGALSAAGYQVRLTDRVSPAAVAGPGETSDVTLTELRNLPALTSLCEDVDTVVHLAANPSADATWEELLEPNIVGVRNVFEAARAAGCRRIVFASSVHAVDGYPEDVPVPSFAPPQPINLYGASKAWGEALGSSYARQPGGPSVLCLRTGWVAECTPAWAERLGNHRFGRVALTHRDLHSLVIASIEAPDTLRFATLNATSLVDPPRLDISETCRLLGWQPQDRLSDILALNPAA